MFGWQAKQKIEAEIALAQSSRESGNEGRARVCARRAAGYAIAEFLSQRSLPLPSPSATDLLAHIQTVSIVPEEIKTIAQHLLVRVNTDYQFPLQVDLLVETRRMVDALEALT